jgi:hypothetical protein
MHEQRTVVDFHDQGKEPMNVNRLNETESLFLTYTKAQRVNGSSTLLKSGLVSVFVS